MISGRERFQMAFSPRASAMKEWTLVAEMVPSTGQPGDMYCFAFTTWIGYHRERILARRLLCRITAREGTAEYG
jgi:hypothetical protein